MSAWRRFAIGFPLSWSHRRSYDLSALERPGRAPYFIGWDPGNGTYGEQWTDAPRDREGVLLTPPCARYHPIRIAQFALFCYGRWHAVQDRAAREAFLAQARWLRDAAVPETGLYRFQFPWLKYGASAGWTSAMAQGEAISVLLRAAELEPKEDFELAAIRAALPFRAPIATGGVVWRDGSDVFFEEIANEHAAHVLNGCIYALWGLWELHARTGDASLQPLVSACAATLKRWIPRFDLGWWTCYSLLRSAAGRPHVATLKYHQFHIAQMHVLAAMFREREFARAADRWTDYVSRVGCRTRVVAATMASLPERALRLDGVGVGSGS
jgi:hypothetical protein